MAEAIKTKLLETEGRKLRTTANGRIEIGPSERLVIPLTKVITLPQVRKKMEEEGIHELAHALVRPTDENTDQISMENMPQVNLLTAEEYEEFREDNAAFWDINVEELPLCEDLPTFTVDGQEKYAVLMAGHRRYNASLLLLESYKEDIELADLVVSPYVGISFDEALAIQIRENVHQRPSPEEEAAAIRAWVKTYSKRLGKDPAVSYISRALGYGEDKVRGALYYTELHEDIKELVKNTCISYTFAVALAGVRKQLYILNQRLAEEGLLNAVVKQYPVLSSEPEVQDDGKEHYTFKLVEKTLETPAEIADYDTLTYLMNVVPSFVRGGKVSKATQDKVTKYAADLRNQNKNPDLNGLQMALASDRKTAERKTSLIGAARLTGELLVMSVMRDPTVLDAEIKDKLRHILELRPGTADLSALSLLAALKRDGAEPLDPELRKQLIAALGVEQELEMLAESNGATIVPLTDRIIISTDGEDIVEIPHIPGQITLTD